MLFILSFVAFATFNSGQAHASEDMQKPKFYGKKVVEIQPGDSLSKIASKNDTTYQRIFYANKKISNPDIIHPGDKVRIPHPKEELKAREIVMPVAPVQPVRTSYYQPATTQQTPAPQTYVAPQAQSSVGSGVWDRLASCESGNNWSINTGNGYYGGLQFNLGTWQSNGGTGYPHQASREEQIRVAENLRAARGFSPWPACSAKLGLS